ncbi:MAG TPA: hypothetical protein VGP08_04635 [Pyrinomonadaceae bacterium]|nr:hypothetical protein [Pyrinomonadaceae bacterium]
MNRTLRTLILICLAVALCSCAAATRPASPDRPRAADAPTFVAIDASDDRRTAALASWRTIVGEQTASNSTAPELRPVTATISALPPRLDAPPRMPLVVISDEKTQTEEETRESLRRFIQTAAPLIGADPKELSLVEVTETQNGARTARYRQSAFQYPLRNGYGEVSITFTEDLRVLALSSTAVPDAERLRRALAAVAQGLPAFDANALLNRAVTYTDRAGSQQTRTLKQTDALNARQLVVYPVQNSSNPSTLELHVAWEVAGGGPSSAIYVYVDAVTGEVLGAAEGNPEVTPQTPTSPPTGRKQ